MIWQNNKEKASKTSSYVVSDGVENCGGNPVQEAKNLHNSNIKAVVNIIGFDVDDAGQKALKAVADAGGGSYRTVSNQEDLKSYFEDEKSRLSWEWLEWGNDSWSSIVGQSNDKHSLLDHISSDFHDLKYRESDHLYSLYYMLLDSDKVTDGDKLHQMLVDRYNMIHNYIVNRYNSINTALKDNEQKALDDVHKKEQEERNKLK